MKVVWVPEARASMLQVARYINAKFGHKGLMDFRQRVKEAEKLIQSGPSVGYIDPLFEDRPLTYRSVIVNRWSKLVYRVEKKTIYIVAFWDGRRDTKALANNVD